MQTTQKYPGLEEIFNLHDIEMMQAPYAMYDELRERCPVSHSDQHGGFFFTTTYAAAKAVFDDFRLFSSAEGAGLPPTPIKMYPIDVDPPFQTKLRKILNRRFTTDAVSVFIPHIEDVVHGLIDGFIESGSTDIVNSLIRPTLAKVVFPIIGVPLEGQKDISHWVELITRLRTTDPDAVQRASASIAAYLNEVIQTRRSEPLKDDVLGALLAATVDGAPLDDDTIFRNILLILFGGLDTTSAVMAEALLYLARDRDSAARLHSGELAWPPAIEEFVRLTAPVQGLRRVATRDTTLCGASIAEGELILALHAAGNRDPSHFPEPNRCLLERKDNDHLSFGSGAHVCLGRHLARNEIRVLLYAVLDRIPDYTVPADFVPEYGVGETRGMKSLPIAFTPGRKREASK